MGIRAAAETTLRGLVLALDNRVRYHVNTRVDDELIDQVRNVDITRLIAKLEARIQRFIDEGITLERASKITLENGYLLSFELTRGGRRIVLTFELVRD